MRFTTYIVRNRPIHELSIDVTCGVRVWQTDDRTNFSLLTLGRLSCNKNSTGSQIFSSVMQQNVKQDTPPP